MYNSTNGTVAGLSDLNLELVAFLGESKIVIVDISRLGTRAKIAYSASYFLQEYPGEKLTGEIVQEIVLVNRSD